MGIIGGKRKDPLTNSQKIVKGLIRITVSIPCACGVIQLYSPQTAKTDIIGIILQRPDGMII